MDGFDNSAIKMMRVHGHMTRMIGYFQAMVSHAESNDRHGYLWTLTSMFRLICVMANDAELAPVLSAACSLKHATDMQKVVTQDEAFDKAKATWSLTRSSCPRCHPNTTWKVYSV